MAETTEDQVVLDPKDVAAELGAIDPAAVPSVQRPDGQPGMTEQLAGADIAAAPLVAIRPPVREVLRTPPPRPGPTLDPAAIEALAGLATDTADIAAVTDPAAAPDPDSGPALSRAVLADVERVIHGERVEAYGPAEDSFARIGAAWSLHLGVPVDAYDVAVMMVLMKAMRAKTDLGRDTPVDIAGYAALMPRCAKAAGR